MYFCCLHICEQTNGRRNAFNTYATHNQGRIFNNSTVRENNDRLRLEVDLSLGRDDYFQMYDSENKCILHALLEYDVDYNLDIFIIIVRI